MLWRVYIDHDDKRYYYAGVDPKTGKEQWHQRCGLSLSHADALAVALRFDATAEAGTLALPPSLRPLADLLAVRAALPDAFWMLRCPVCSGGMTCPEGEWPQCARCLGA